MWQFVAKNAPQFLQKATTTFGKRMPYVSVGVGGYMLGQEMSNRRSDQQMKQMYEAMAQQNYSQNMPVAPQQMPMPQGPSYYQNGMPQPIEVENHYYEKPRRKRRKPSREEIEAYLAEQEEY